MSEETRRVGRRAVTLAPATHLKILIVNLVVTAALAAFGYWLELATPEFLAFLLLQLGLFQVGVAIYRVYADDDPAATQRLVSRVALAGLLGLIAVATLAAVWRVSRGVGYVALGGALALVLLVLRDWFPRRDQALRGTQIGAVLLAIPFLVAWTLVSTYWLLARPGAPPPSPAALTAERTRRDARQARAPEVTVAVTLSGGGYRAAAFHAGVLRALDAAQVPIQYLSTVSGGSIVGAYYALGHAPEAFLERLARPPRLPNDLFTLGAVLGHLVWPGYGSGDTYAAHFDRVLFGGRTLRPEHRPILLVNVTEYESGQRQVFPSVPDDRFPDLGDVPAARLVAASGAFPGAFSPVEIEGRHYLDGGARENLGMEGLRLYLLRNAPDRPLPRIVVISNAGKALAAIDEPPAKIWRGDALLRASATTFDEVHHQIFRHYLADRYFPGRPGVPQPVSTPASTLFGPWVARDEPVPVFAVSLRPGEALPFLPAAATGGPASASCRTIDAVRAAADLDTLAELDSDTLERVACIGTWLMEARIPTLSCLVDALRDRARDPLGRCPPA